VWLNAIEGRVVHVFPKELSASSSFNPLPSGVLHHAWTSRQKAFNLRPFTSSATVCTMANTSRIQGICTTLLATGTDSISRDGPIHHTEIRSVLVQTFHYSFL
jgi:hypothetical protein